jgi:hypothetical protein
VGIQQRVDRKLKEIDDLFDEDEIELPPIVSILTPIPD